MNYYEQQLEKLGNIKTGTTGKTVNVKFLDSEGKETNYLTLNDESATAIVKMLTENFNIKIPSDKFGADWCLQDIIEKAEEEGHTITEVQAREIADHLEYNHDATIGINWDTISEAIFDYFED